MTITKKMAEIIVVDIKHQDLFIMTLNLGISVFYVSFPNFVLREQFIYM